VKTVIVVAVVSIAFAGSESATAQIRASQAAAPRPGPPRPPSDSPFRNFATSRPRPVSPTLGIPVRHLTFPVFPIAWGWGPWPLDVDTAGLTINDGPTGGVQLDVQPWRARVYVDGVYVGRVDDFKGYYQHLDVLAGPHQIVIVEPGYLPLVFDVVVVPGRTLTYRGTLNEPAR
jgi:hypothetical protein